MGGDHSKIVTKDVPYEEIKQIKSVEMSKFCPPFRKFRNQKKTEKGRNLQITVEIQQPDQKIISYTQECYKDMEDAFEAKTKDIQLEAVLSDEQFVDRDIYIAKQKQKQLVLQIRPFANYNSHVYNSILYELNINQEIRKFNCPNLNTIIQSYIIQTGLQIEGEQFPNSQIFVNQPIATNLSEIIKYRRQNKWYWTVNQFNVLANDLCKAVKVLHRNSFFHNDIRPFNVYYSLQKKGYQLGGFSNTVKKISNENKYQSLRTSMFFQDPQLEGGQNLQKGDIYSLGMTLLCAFYLCEPINIKAASPYNKKYEEKYKIMKLICQMLMPLKRRNNLDKIMIGLESGQPSPKMKSLIQSLRYKNAPKDRRLIQTKRALSEGYQRLGLWNQWRDNINDAYELEVSTLDDYKKAGSLSQLARIQSYRGDSYNANKNAKNSSKIFRNLGYAAYDQGNINQAISLFTKAIQSSKYFESDKDIDLAKSLQGLALAHSQKGDYEVAKPLISQSADLALKISGKGSLDYCKIRISEAQIQSDYGEFDSAGRILSQCFSISESQAKINEGLGLQLKAQILHDSGRNLMMQHSFGQYNSKSQYLDRAERDINQALEINEQLFNHNLTAANVQTYGEIQMRKGNYIAARNNFKKAQSIRQTYLKEQNRSGTMEKEKADNLCHIAACETEMGEFQLSLKTYNRALQIYRTSYGSDHNKLSAIVIGNMSNVYYKLKENARARQCVRLAIQIIEDVSGVDDPDYEHFKYMERNIQQ